MKHKIETRIKDLFDDFEAEVREEIWENIEVQIKLR
jgi:hypothetical protein